MNDFNNGNHKGKVFSMEKHKEERHKEKCRGFEGTRRDDANESVHQLLDHMRRIRQAVPVNKKLQAELRQVLLNNKIKRESPAVSDFSLSPPEPGLTRNFNPRFWCFLVGILIAAVMIIVWLIPSGTYLKPVGNPVTVMRFWHAGAETDLTVSPEGDAIVARNGKLLLSKQSSSEYRVLDMPVSWRYQSPAFSPNGKEVALVRRQKGSGPQIVVIKAKDLLNKDYAAENLHVDTLITGKEEHEYSDITWSPDGSSVAYTDTVGSVSRVYIAGDKGISDYLCFGSNPAWSPDGSKIVVQRRHVDGNNFLYLVPLKSGIAKALGQGEQAAWSKDGFLVFVLPRQEERVLTYLPDGSPQFTVRQRIGEVRSVYAGGDGVKLMHDDKPEEDLIKTSTLLVTTDPGVTGTEIEWLKKLEQEGVREPRALSLDEAHRSTEPVFGDQGRELFYSRRENGMTSVLRIDLEERLWDRGERQL